MMRTIIILMLGMSATCLRAQPDMTILHNATIYTVDDDRPTADALVFHEGRILAVGASGQLLADFPEARQIDAAGATVVPGLIDAHAHLMSLGMSLLQVDLVGTRSVDEVIERLRTFAKALPAGAWLTGRGWDQNEWPVQAFPTASDLDAAFPDRPIYLTRVDGHAAWVNTAAIELAGGLDDRDDPAGGRIVRDDAGRPTGVLIDAATRYVGHALPEPSAAERRLALDRALAVTARYGLTGVHDAGVSLEDIALFRETIDANRFTIRNYAMIDGRGTALDHFCDAGPLTDYGGRLSVRSIKLYMDGALGSRGAALLEDYADDPGNDGLLMYEAGEFAAIVERALNCGLQVNTHAIGDRGARVVLDVYEAQLRDRADDAGRHRMEHAQVVSPEDVPRFADLGVIAAVQPIHATSDMGWAEERLGPERVRHAYAWRTLVDGGSRLALGSDFPVEPVSPLVGFHAAITRQDADGQPPGGWLARERLSRAEALRGFTLDAAYAAFMEGEVGSLTEGKRADFVLLDRDVMVVDPSEILETHVLATYLDGEAVYVAE